MQLIYFERIYGELPSHRRNCLSGLPRERETPLVLEQFLTLDKLSIASCFPIDMLDLHANRMQQGRQQQQQQQLNSSKRQQLQQNCQALSQFSRLTLRMSNVRARVLLAQCKRAERKVK